MLIAIAAALAFLFLGGSDGLLIVEQIHEKVPVVITDKAQAEVILEQAKAMDSIAQDAKESLGKDLEAWSKADREHTVGRGTLKKVLEKSAKNRAEARKEFLDTLFEMKSKMTKEQWEAVFKEETK